MIIKRGYISNISAEWTFDRQRDVLKEMTDLYSDELTKAQIKRARVHGDGAVLKDRGRMLRPTSRQTDRTFYIAAWACFAWNTDDLLVALAQAAACRSTIVCLGDGTQITPVPEMEQLEKVIAAFKVSKKRAQTGPGRETGAEASKRVRGEDIARRIALISEDWPKREVSTPDLLARAGTKKAPMAYATAVKHLKNRPHVQHLYEVRVERATTKEARKNERDEA